jgi:hypothetical protein
MSSTIVNIHEDVESDPSFPTISDPCLPPSIRGQRPHRYNHWNPTKIVLTFLACFLLLTIVISSVCIAVRRTESKADVEAEAPVIRIRSKRVTPWPETGAAAAQPPNPIHPSTCTETAMQTNVNIQTRTDGITQTMTLSIAKEEEIEAVMTKHFITAFRRINALENASQKPTAEFHCQNLADFYDELKEASKDLQAAFDSAHVNIGGHKQLAKTFKMYRNFIRHNILPRYESLMHAMGVPLPEGKEKRETVSATGLEAVHHFMHVLIRSKLSIKRHFVVLENWKDKWLSN